jgi:hypothetical protein
MGKKMWPVSIPLSEEGGGGVGEGVGEREVGGGGGGRGGRLQSQQKYLSPAH